VSVNQWCQCGLVLTGEAHFEVGTICCPHSEVTCTESVYLVCLLWGYLSSFRESSIGYDYSKLIMKVITTVKTNLLKGLAYSGLQIMLAQQC
jgi:hypothetical protein